LGLKAEYLIIDHDTKYTGTFDTVFEAEGAQVKRVGPQAPNMNAYAERWVQSLRTECLDHFLILGEKHLAYIVKEFVAHYNEERPHQGVGNVPLSVASEPESVILKFPCGEVKCRERLGGLLKHYHRAAA
jgi:putative transposase